MKYNVIHKSLVYVFIIISLAIIIYCLLITLNLQLVIKYHFDDCIAHKNNIDYSYLKDLFVDMLLYIKFIIVYAIIGLVISLQFVFKKKKIE